MTSSTCLYSRQPRKASTTKTIAIRLGQRLSSETDSTLCQHSDVEQSCVEFKKFARIFKAGFFFQHFCENSSAKKTQNLPFGQKLKPIFVQKLKLGAAFLNIEKILTLWHLERLLLQIQHQDGDDKLKGSSTKVSKSWELEFNYILSYLGNAI